MYLSKLEVVGFKSFAQKTALRFNDGVSAIVGPNGCGKTNVVDAIRWVLGEQKSSVLRSDAMEHVIFNGTRNRKPLGMAEVSLTIQNNKNILPTEYSEVVITRRLFRSGESQYLLNKTQCRLRDIVDLFMDTGMGADAYSVIELKMIETILSDRADERRHLFEEAAGVTKYKIRRREAVRKLDAVQRDLARVQDILREVQKTVNSLGRQADKARAHQELSAQLRQLETLILVHDMLGSLSSRENLNAELSANRAQLAEKDAEIEKLEEKFTEIENLQAALDEELQRSQDAERSAGRSVSQATQNLAVARERILALERTKERIEREGKEFAQTKQNIEQRMLQAHEKSIQAKKSAEETEREFSSLKSQRDIAREAVQTLRAASRPANEAVQKISDELNSLRSSRERQRAHVENLRRRVDETAHEIKHLQSSLAAIAEHEAKEATRIMEFDAKLMHAEVVLHEAQDRQNELQATVERVQHDLSEHRTSLSHKTASLEFLSGLVDTGESSLFLMRSGAWKPSGEKILLAEAVGVDDTFRVAVEAALGEAAKFFVVDSREDALAACSALQSHGKGKATFVCRELIPAMPAPGDNPVDAENFGWASEIVRCDETLRSALRGFLGRTTIVATLEKAWQLISARAADTAVTLAGEVVRASGVIRGGAMMKTEGLAVGKRERIQQLQEEIAELQNIVAQLNEELRVARQELGGINIKQLSGILRQIEAEKNSQQQKLSQVQYRRDTMEANLERHQESMKKFLAEGLEIEDQEKSFAEKIGVLDEQKSAAQAELRRHMDDLHEAEENLSEWEAKTRAAEIGLIRIQNEKNSLEQEINRLENEEIALERRMKDRGEELRQTEISLAELNGQTGEGNAELERLRQELGRARAEREAVEKKFASLKDQLHRQAEEIRAGRKQHERILSSVHEIELRTSEINLRIEDFERRAAELELNLEEALQQAAPEGFMPVEAKTSAQQLRSKIASLGNVNFMALEEHQKESERLEFITAQVKDLVESEKTLQQTIREINETAQQRFTETFEKIQQNFSGLFTMLFNGDGEAEVKLGEGDPLEAMIEINAKPRGKRPHSIEMLSGGEKTLTAIALLFSIYMVKPSPFCILDEVDAPLDDANIDRYLRIIRKFSTETQFLMITHNKKTMEAADVLYGVTMEEQGVSKVVSVKFEGKEVTEEVSSEQ